MSLTTVASAPLLVGNTLDRPTTPSQILTFWDQQRNQFSLYNGTSWEDSSASQSADVTSFGAIGDGSAANTATNDAAILAAINSLPATGGILYFPPGYYYISDAIVLKSYVHVMGAGPQATRIRQTNSTKNGFVATDTLYVTIEELTLIGPGAGTGIGMHFIYVAQVTSYLTLRSLNLQSFGSDGIRVDRCIVSIVDKVISQGHLEHGFSVLDGTSINFISTFALSCNRAGYNINSMNYLAMVGTAADFCGIGYRIVGSREISMIGCGCEESRNLTATYNATGVFIDSSFNCVINGMEDFGNNNISVHVTGSSTGIVITGFRENTPNGTATSSIKVDAGSIVTLMSPKIVTAMSLAGTVNFPDLDVVAIKTANETINNNNVLQNDDALVVAVTATTKYLVRAMIMYDSATAADIQFSFVGPASATMSWTTNALGTTAAGGTGNITVAASVIGDAGVLPAGGAGVGVQLMANIQGILNVGATAGTLQFRWAQNTADVSDTIVRANSHLYLKRIA